MRSFLTATNEAHIALMRRQEEEQVKVSKSAAISHYQLRCWPNTQALDWLCSCQFRWKYFFNTHCNISNGSESAWSRCPNVKPPSHYCRQSGQQHLYAHIMESQHRAVEEAIMDGAETKTGAVLRKEG